MLRTIRRVAVPAAAAAGLTVALAGAASGDVAVDAVNCAGPVVAGGVAPRNLVVGEVYQGAGLAQAYASCSSDRNGTATLSLVFEYQPYPGAPYQAVEGCASTSAAPSAFGVVAISSPVLSCAYRSQVTGGQPVRAHATLTHSERPGQTWHGYSLV